MASRKIHVTATLLAKYAPVLAAVCGIAPVVGDRAVGQVVARVDEDQGRNRGQKHEEKRAQSIGREEERLGSAPEAATEQGRGQRELHGEESRAQHRYGAPPAGPECGEGDQYGEYEISKQHGVSLLRW